MNVERAVHIYRIVQEIIHNCLRHADAGLLSISIVKEKNKLLLQAVDDGKGFEAEKVIKHGTGHGLSNLLSRVEMLNGYIYIKSKPGSGSSITIEIPQ
jgi:two-component system NarL family sensor kinase